MNSYQVLIILLLIIPFTIDFVVDRLNLSRLTTTLPREFKGVYKLKDYKKSQLYLQANTNFHLVESGITLFLLIIFIVVGGFNWVNNVALTASSSVIMQGLIFSGILLLLSTAISLPFSIYETFVIEEKFGFNKSTWVTFTKDTFINLVLTMILGGLVFAVLIFVFSELGSLAWVLAWILMVLFQLFLLFISPIIIMPLFNKFIPLQSNELKKGIEDFAKKENFALAGIFTMDGSKRSTKSNAFFTGIGKFRRIVFYDTLLSQHTNSEIIAILAHEIGHYKKNHIIKLLILSILITGVSLWALSLFIGSPALFEAFEVDTISIYASLVFIFIFLSPVFELVGVVNNYISRKFEFQADKFAIDEYGHKQDFINALKKLSVNNLSNLTPHPAKVFKDYSHPPILERLKAIK
jgi:STE24 endopeptidase